MKKLTAAIAVLVMFSLFPVQVGASGKEKKSAAPTAGKSGARPYTGDGGKGVSLAILAPRGSGLAAAQNYLPELVQGEFVSNFSGYSAMSVLDRVNLDKVFAETLSGYYKDDAPDVLRLGRVAQTNYIMTGTVTRTASGYSLQAQIASTSDGMTRASYSGTCTAAELDNLTGVRRASLELLGKMGVELTEQAKRELSGAAAANQVNAQTSLARGIAAQRGGNVAETLARFYEANSYDPSLAEAAARANAVSANIRSGSLGERLRGLRNDMAWRAEWRKILEDAAAFLWRQRFVVAEVSYKDMALKARADYKAGTMEFTYNPGNIWVKPLPYPPAYLKMIADLNKGLKATGRNKDWGLTPLYAEGIIPFGNYQFSDAKYAYSEIERRKSGNILTRPYIEPRNFGAVRITVSLINSKGQVVDVNDYNPIPLGNNAQGIYIPHPYKENFLDEPKVAAKPGVKYSIASTGGLMGALAKLFDGDSVPKSFSVRADSRQADYITDEMALEITAEFVPMYDGRAAEKYDTGRGGDAKAWDLGNRAGPVEYSPYLVRVIQDM